MESLIKNNIKELKPYIVDNELFNIKLDANENAFNIFPELKEECYNRMEKLDLNRYPDTDSRDLSKAIAKYNGIEAENIICGNGSDEIIQMIINTFVDKEETIVVPDPTFSMYEIFTRIVGGKTIKVPSTEDFNIDVEGIIKSAKDNSAKIVFLCSPNNPTGNLISRGAIQKIIRETSSIVVIDEAYGEFSNTTNIDQIGNPRVIVLRTFSKAFALAGIRLGYGIAHTRTIDILKRVRAPYNLNIFSQIMGITILENYDMINNAMDKIIKEKDRVIEQLSSIENIEVFPSAANFILIRSEKSQDILGQCKACNISLRPFDQKSVLKNCIRISIGSENENNEIINLIKGVVENETS